MRLRYSRLSSPLGEGNGSPLQYPCLENPMDKGAWGATVHEAAESQTRRTDSAAAVSSPLQRMLLVYSLLCMASKVLIEHVKAWLGTPLVVQWLRTCLPTPGTQVRSLGQEDPTWWGTTKPMGYNY